MRALITALLLAVATPAMAYDRAVEFPVMTAYENLPQSERMAWYAKEENATAFNREINRLKSWTFKLDGMDVQAWFQYKPEGPAAKIFSAAFGDCVLLAKEQEKVYWPQLASLPRDKSNRVYLWTTKFWETCLTKKGFTQNYPRENQGIQPAVPGEPL